MKKIVFFVLFLMIFCNLKASFIVAEEDYVKVPGLIHLNSDVSSGEDSPEEMTGAAKEEGIKAVFLTENLSPKWEYGIFPLRNVIKKTVIEGGLLAYGPEKYKKRIQRISEEFPGVEVLMAAEVAPFYFWTGTPFGKKDLTLNDWDIQFIVAGMDPADYKGIPTVSNRGFMYYGPGSVLKLWPFLLIIPGVIFLRKKTSRISLPNFICWLLIIIGTVFAVNNLPFKEAKYDQYHGRQGIGPYQEVIDYVNSKGGMTFWSNPEVYTRKRIGPIMYVSTNASSYMREAENYTGFCCFYEGYRSVGAPGGIWDMVLGEYCVGGRSKPVWAIGEMSYHGKEAADRKRIDEVQAVFLVPSNTRSNIFDAMRNGRMYATRGTEEYTLQLDSFAVEYSGKEAMMGEDLKAAGPVTVAFKVSWKGKANEKITAKLIRSGGIVKEFVIDSPGKYKFEDDFYLKNGKIYYRLDIRGKYPNMLFSNPIFVTFTEREDA